MSKDRTRLKRSILDISKDAPGPKRQRALSRERVLCSQRSRVLNYVKVLGNLNEFLQHKSSGIATSAHPSYDVDADRGAIADKGNADDDEDWEGDTIQMDGEDYEEEDEDEEEDEEEEDEDYEEEDEEEEDEDDGGRREKRKRKRKKKVVTVITIRRTTNMIRISLMILGS